MRKLIIIVTWILLGGTLSAQPYFCAQVLPDGKVDILVIGNPAANTTYEVYWSGDFTFTADTSTVVNSGAAPNFTINLTSLINANTNFYNFQVTVTRTSGLTTTHFFNIISLDAYQILPSVHEVVNLRWNRVHLLIPGTYYLERLDNGTWVNIYSFYENASNAFMTYNDIVEYPHCDETGFVPYRVRFVADSYSGCNSISNTDLVNAYEARPENPTVDSVSVSTDPLEVTWLGHPIISWTPTAETDITKYYILRSDGGAYFIVDSVTAGQNYYVDLTESGCLTPYSYAVQAKDQCGKLSPGPDPFTQNTLILEIEQIDPCEKSTRLTWNEYRNMKGGLAGYYLYRRDYMGVVTKIGPLPPGVTSYIDENDFLSGRTYTYRITAFSNDGLTTSGSCENSQLFNGPAFPDTIYIEQASVINDSEIELRFYLSPPNRATHVVVERADQGNNGRFASIATVPLDYVYGIERHFIINDNNVNVDGTSYRYRLLFVDACGNILRSSSYNVSKTILLKATTEDNRINTITWNHYEGWISGVQHYHLFRTIDGVEESLPILIDNTQTSYTDDDPELSSRYYNSEICYRVVAYEAAGNLVSPNAFASSNTSCVVKEPSFAAPNAFSPYSLTNFQFRPVINDYLLTSYSMEILNKWGQKLFESFSPTYGWNGFYNGQLSSSDVYIYVIKYTSKTGKEYVKRGTFLLLL